MPGMSAGAPGESGPAGSAGSTQAMPPQSIVGQDVTDENGDTIGQVSGISGDNVIVSTSQALGIGARDVSVPWSEFKTQQGATGKSALQLSMSKDDFRGLPAFQGGAGNSGTDSSGGAGQSGSDSLNGPGGSSPGALGGSRGTGGTGGSGTGGAGGAGSSGGGGD